MVDANVVDTGNTRQEAATYYYMGDLDSAIDYWDVAPEAYPDLDLLRNNLKYAQMAREINPSWKPTLTIEQKK
jgi:hypothetical protein